MTKTYVERWDAGCDSRPLLEEADREIQRLNETLTCPRLTADAPVEQYKAVLADLEKGLPVNGQDTINALHWRVRNQTREIARQLEQKATLRADISQAYDLRDKAEGRYCTALGEIERLTRERDEYKIWWERDSISLGTALNDLSMERACKQDLQARVKTLMDVIDSRDRALGFVPLDELTHPEPRVSRCTCIPAVTHDDYCATKSSAYQPPPPEILADALQDVVHKDPGPVRAGHAVREAPSPEVVAHSKSQQRRFDAQGVKWVEPASREATPLMGRHGSWCTCEACLTERGIAESRQAPMYRHECPHFVGFTSVADYTCAKCTALKSAEQPTRWAGWSEGKPLPEPQARSGTFPCGCAWFGTGVPTGPCPIHQRRTR